MRQRLILIVLDRYPGGVLVEVLLSEIAAPGARRERAKLLDALHRLAARGQVTLAGKQHRTEIAGALVTRSVDGPGRSVEGRAAVSAKPFQQRSHTASMREHTDIRRGVEPLPGCC